MQTTSLYQFPSLANGQARFSINPLPTLGAEVVGLDLNKGVSSDQIFALRVALVNYKMLVLRDQPLTPEKQIFLTHFFGHELHRAGPKLRYIADHPEIFRITNRAAGGNPNTGQYWHSDGHYLANPSSITVMHIVNATPDGPTLVTDNVEAFDRLSSEERLYFSHFGFYATETGITHPILRPHPLTGKLGLYVNLRAIPVDRQLNQHPEVSKLVDRHLNQPGTYHEHHWREGDTIIVDNFATSHKGMPSSPANLRVMHRTSLTGPSVWWHQ